MTHSLHLTGRMPFVLVTIAAAVAIFESTAIAQSQTPFQLDVPAKSVPVPPTVSPEMQKIIGLPLRTNWNVLPKTGDEWKPVAEAGAAGTIKNLPGISERLKVKVESSPRKGCRVLFVTRQWTHANTGNGMPDLCQRG